MPRTKNVHKEPSASSKMVERRKRHQEEHASQRPFTASTPTAEAPQPSLPTDKCTSKAITPSRQINFNFLAQKGFSVFVYIYLLHDMLYKLHIAFILACVNSEFKEEYNLFKKGKRNTNTKLILYIFPYFQVLYPFANAKKGETEEVV